MPTCLRARVVDVPTCLRASVVDVLSCLRVNVPINANFSLRATLPINVLMFHTACQWSNVACQRAKRRASFSNWLSSIPKNARVFQTLLLRNAKGNFYILYFIIIKKKSICIFIIHKHCIILHSYTSCHNKQKCVEFLFFIIFSRNENIKRPGFYTLQVTRVLSNFP